jgi:glutaminase
VTDVEVASSKLLLGLATRLIAGGKQLLLSGVWRHKQLERLIAEQLVAGEGAGAARTFPNLDQALEAAETQLIAARSAGAVGAPQELPLAEHDLLRGLSPTASAAVQARLKLQTFRRGEMLVRQGDLSGDIFLITKGEVSVVLELPGGQAKRLSTLSAGMTFGELTALSGAGRTADVRADSAVECYILPKSAWEALADVSPAARMGLLENMLRSAAALAMSLTAEVATLEG